MTRWRTYSIFVSSTFADMQAERDYLRTHVFPLINAELKRYSISLRVIDLRWGINTLDASEESREEKVLRVCRNEINRSKPFFLCLLGCRYGWSPTIETRGLDKSFLGKSITSIEIDYGFFQRDDTMGCLFVERDPICYQQMDCTKRIEYDDSQNENRRCDWEKLVSLKRDIKHHLKTTGRSDHYRLYHPKWDGKQFSDFGDFCEIVKQGILNDISHYCNQEKDISPYYDLQCLQDGILHFGQQKLYKRDIINELYSTIVSGKGILVITGEHGSGKSSSYTILANQLIQQNSFIVLYHSTNAGQESRDVSLMLSRWIYQLEELFTLEHAKTENIDSSIDYFRRLINKVPTGKKIILLIDNIDGLLPSKEADFLTFYPRQTNERYILVCTCSLVRMELLSSYHHSLQTFRIPSLSNNEANNIINRYLEFENKELYPQIVLAILSKERDTHKCYESPLWLSIAFNYISNLSQSDFYAVKLAELQQGFTYDDSLINLLNNKIAKIPPDSKNLFIDWLESLQDFYGHFPINLIKYLSVSYDGLEESIIEKLMGTEWYSLTFAIVTNFLQNYVVEQGLTKSWKIAIPHLKLIGEETEEESICKKIANIHIQSLYNEKEVVNDNICYYLFKGKQVKFALRYFNHSASDNLELLTRSMAELYQIAKTEDLECVLSFVLQVFDVENTGPKYFWSRLTHSFQLKKYIEYLVDNANQEGRYKMSLQILDVYQTYLKKQKLPEDIKMFYYIATKDKKIAAIRNLYGTQKTIEEITAAIKLLKIRGPISLVLVPIVSLLDKFELLKLSN